MPVFKLTTKVELDPPLTTAQRKAVLRRVGAKMATRIRKRLRARKELRDTGQMLKSIRFKLRKRGGRVVGVIWPQGVRRDSDTHKRRRPMKNFSIAAFHAAKGRDPLQFSSEDEAVFGRMMEEEVTRVLARREKT